jgi:hypothetical protein
LQANTGPGSPIVEGRVTLGSRGFRSPLTTSWPPLAPKIRHFVADAPDALQGRGSSDRQRRHTRFGGACCRSGEVRRRVDNDVTDSPLVRSCAPWLPTRPGRGTVRARMPCGPAGRMTLRDARWRRAWTGIDLWYGGLSASGRRGSCGRCGERAPYRSASGCSRPRSGTPRCRRSTPPACRAVAPPARRRRNGDGLLHVTPPI